jgi:hypothetical protein
LEIKERVQKTGWKNVKLEVKSEVSSIKTERRMCASYPSIVRSEGTSVKHFFVVFQKFTDVGFCTASYLGRTRRHERNSRMLTNPALMRTPASNPIEPFNSLFSMMVCRMPPSEAPQVTMDITIVLRRSKWCDRIAKLGTYISP